MATLDERLSVALDRILARTQGPPQNAGPVSRLSVDGVLSIALESVDAGRAVERMGLRFLRDRRGGMIFENGGEGCFCVVWNPSTLASRRVVFRAGELPSASFAATRLVARRLVVACDEIAPPKVGLRA